MDKENTVAAKVEEPTTRITRARAKALETLGGVPPASKASFKDDHRRVLRANTKRTASDANKASITAISGLQCKRRAVLKDVTNVMPKNSFANCINGTKVQVKLCILLVGTPNSYFKFQGITLVFFKKIYFCLMLPIFIYWFPNLDTC